MRSLSMADVQSRRMRYSHYFTLLYCAFGLFIGMNLRDATLYATTIFRNSEVGIVAYYPKDWLLDTSTGVMRVTDAMRPGFKTVIEIQVLPFGTGMSGRNVIDGLALERGTDLPLYLTLSISESLLRGQDSITVHEYRFVYAPSDPFLQSIPSVVIGRDVLLIRRNQAILISFQTDDRTYDQDLVLFERFLESLEY